MRTIAAALAFMMMMSAAQAETLFDKKRLECVLEYGGEWNFVKFPPELERLPKKQFAIRSIDLANQRATDDAGGDLIAIKGVRSVVFATKHTTLSVMAKATPSGYPVIWTNVEAQRAGFCH